MHQYLELLQNILENGEEKGDRTGTGTISIFGTQTKYDLRDGFPLVTTKKVKFEAIVRELLWFIHGCTNINDQNLTDHTPIWDAWANDDGELGPIYGYQWRNWERFTWNEETKGYDKSHVDQLMNVINTLKTNPNSRRIIISAWNVADVPRMNLPPCHAFMQFYVVNGRLDCQLYQRSADTALGVPYNIASYAALMHIIAMECDLVPGIFTHTLGDAHIYSNHTEGINKQLARTPHKLPELKIVKKPILDLTIDDFLIENYTHDKYIKFKVAV